MQNTHAPKNVHIRAIHTFKYTHVQSTHIMNSNNMYICDTLMKYKPLMQNGHSIGTYNAGIHTIAIHMQRIHAKYS